MALGDAGAEGRRCQESGCTSRRVLHATRCYAHILNDTNQRLFAACSRCGGPAHLVEGSGANICGPCARGTAADAAGLMFFCSMG
jgi:hypothetical protein